VFEKLITSVISGISDCRPPACRQFFSLTGDNQLKNGIFSLQELSPWFAVRCQRKFCSEAGCR